MKRARIISVLSVLVMLASLGAIWRALHDAPPSAPSDLPAEVGRVLAAEAGKLLGPGGRIVLISRDTESFPQPSFDALNASMQKALKQAGTPPALIRAIQLDPLRPLQVPPGDFVELLRKAGPADVIVSLLGPPFLSDEQRAAVGTVKPKVVAFWPGTLAEYGNLRPLFEQRLLSAAILHRPEGLGLAAKGGAPAAGRSARFDQLYQIVAGTGIPPVPLPGIP
jgi:hypothetical protein